MTITDGHAISLVKVAYKAALEFRMDKEMHIKLPLLEQASKSWVDCLKFYQAAEDVNVSIIDFMLAAFEGFPAKWCKKTYGRVYPPMKDVVGEKSREKTKKSLPPDVNRGMIKRNTDMYIRQLSHLNKDIALEMVRTGALSGGNQSLQDELLRRVEEEF